MVYVLGLDFLKEREEVNLIKIGYTSDWETRSKGYNSMNPAYKLLYLLEDGDMALEKSLHARFRQFKYKGGKAKEWFWRDQSIIDFFESLPTKEDEFLGEFRKLRTIYDRLCYIRDYQFRGEPERNRLLDLIGEPYKSLS